MRPKKIYLNYEANSTDAEIIGEAIWSSVPAIATDCNLINAEYTDLSQVWHDATDEIRGDGDVILIWKEHDEDENSATVTTKSSIECIDRINKGREDTLPTMEYVYKWAYLSDILAKDLEGVKL